MALLFIALFFMSISGDNVLPNTYGGSAHSSILGTPSGQLFAFSGLDGPTNSSSMFFGDSTAYFFILSSTVFFFFLLKAYFKINDGPSRYKLLQEDSSQLYCWIKQKNVTKKKLLWFDMF